LRLSVITDIKNMVHHRFLELVKIDHNFSSKVKKIPKTKGLSFNHFDCIVDALHNAI
jgi:hypothetical protein